MKRKVKDLPKHFVKGKAEIDRLLRVYWSNKLNEKQQANETPENLALLFVLVEELTKYIDIHLTSVGNKLLEKMETLNKFSIPLPEYGKKVFWDKEAQWLYIEDMDDEDWRKYDEECNKAYLESKK